MSKPPNPGSEFDKPGEPRGSVSASLFALFQKNAPDGTADTAQTNPPEPEPCAVVFDKRKFYWTLRDLPLKEATKHMLVCGTTGSGKTTLISLFLQSITPRFRRRRGAPEQLIIFDAKGDMLPLLAGMGLRPDTRKNFWLLHPVDQRGARWNIAEAAADPLRARQVATLLVPEERQSSAPYFADAARELVFASILALNHKRGRRWSFRDLLCSLDSVARVKAFTHSVPAARRIAMRIVEDDKHASGVLSTLGARLGRFEQVAALWSTPGVPQFSISKFLKQSGVLVLSNDSKLRESIWPINALLLKALTDEILSQPETQQPRFWFVLDEFRAMQSVPCIHDLLNRGRSKGAAVLLGAQSIEGLIEIHGDQAANDLLSQCAYKTFLRAGGPVTGEWAERYFHKVRAVERTVSESWGAQGHSHTQQLAVQDRSLFLSATFQDLPLPELGGPLMAISDVPCLRQVRISERSFDLMRKWCRGPAKRVPPLIPRTNPKAQQLEPWSDAEVARHCPPPPEQATAPTAGGPVATTTEGKDPPPPRAERR